MEALGQGHCGQSEMARSAGEAGRSLEDRAGFIGFIPKDKRKPLKSWRGSIWTWSDLSL